MFSRLDETAMNSMPQRFRAHFVNSLSGYISPDGLTNLAIVSSMFHLGADPPLMGLTINQVHLGIHR